MSFLGQIHSWQGFKSALTDETNKVKGDSFEALTHAYLKLDPKYATHLEEVWLLRDVPVDVRDHLNLPNTDEGIDLIARTCEGAYWAIQCKYVEDEDKSLSRRSLSTFTDLALNICDNIEYCLVCTSADRYSHKLKMYEGNLGFLSGEVWRGLEGDFFTNLHELLQGHKPTLEPRTPRPHQQRAIDNAVEHFLTEGNARGKLILPCGTGKSLTGYWIADQLNANHILVTVPSLALVRQTLNEWLRESVALKRDVHWIAVCSDVSVGSQEDITVLPQDLGIKIHTDPQQIADWLSVKHDGLTVVFTTYQSGRAIAEASRLADVTFDLGIMDEAHKTVGKNDSLFSHLLFDENISIRNRVFMTATERRYLGQSDRIASMNDPVMYGDTFELQTFKEALEADPPILSDYKIVTIVVTRNEIRQLVQENSLVSPDHGKWDDDVEAEMLAAAVALRKAMQKHPIKHSVSFHSSIARAKVFKSTQDALSMAIPEFGQLETFHVSGKTPTALRSRELERFVATSPSLVTNARCLTEGIDVPGIDCILFADPKRSTVDIVQAVGRALRRSEGKEFGYVVVPVLIDSEIGEDVEAQFDAFTPVLTVLRSLAGNDDRIVEYFRSVSEGRQSRESGKTEIIDIPDGIFVDTQDFISSIELKLWSKLAKLSWMPFEEAREFVRSKKIVNWKEWNSYCKGDLPEKGKCPENIPANPNVIYRDNGWKNFGDWLGTGATSNQLRAFRSFQSARAFVRTLNLKSHNEWRSYRRGDMPQKEALPIDIPAAPNITYKDKGWLGYGDWLGTGAVAARLRVYRSFDDARTFARNLNLVNQNEWQAFCKGELPEKGNLPDDIPSNPNNTYKDKGWTGHGDWLGTGRIATFKRAYRSFEEAREFVRSLDIKSQTEWLLFCRGQLPEKGNLPDDIPLNPNKTYKDKGWTGYGDWLGTGRIATFKRAYRSFEEAREFVRGLDLKNEKEWRLYKSGRFPERGLRPDDIPSTPQNTYKDKGWQGYGDWLGTGRIADQIKEYRPFEEARNFAQSLNLKKQKEWYQFCGGELPEKGNLPDDIPSNPNNTYKDKGWTGYGDWLGTDTVAFRHRKFRPFEEALEFSRGLGLKTEKEWFAYCKGEIPEKGTLPGDIPVAPAKKYKNDGWQGMKDWLGTDKK